jgi:hypothetical protein
MDTLDQNYKGKLLEFFQREHKNQRPNIKFIHTNQGDPHQCLWTSMLQIGEPYNIQCSATASTKIIADQIACQKALKLIKKSKAKTHIQKLSPINTSSTDVTFSKNLEEQSYYLIDLESKPQFDLQVKPNCFYVGVINQIHHAIKRYSDWIPVPKEVPNKILLGQKSLHMIKGGIKDLVDHYLTFLSARLVDEILANNTAACKVKIIIVTGDHAGDCTRVCLDTLIKAQGLDWQIELETEI